MEIRWIVLTIVLILCALIWLPILLHQMSGRGLLILLIWLCIAPIGQNLIRGETNPFFQTPITGEELSQITAPRAGEGYHRAETTIRARDLLEPTRTLMGAFLLVFLLEALIKKKRLLSLDKVEIWMVIFSGILILGVFLLSNRLAFGLRTATDAFIIPFTGYYVARRLVTSENSFRLFMQVLAYTGFYILLICLVERMVYTSLTYRVSGPFEGGPALHMVLIVAFFIILLLDSGHNRDLPGERLLLPLGVSWLILYLTPIVIFLTLSRGNWIGLLMAMMAFFLLRIRLIRFSKRLVTIGCGLILVPAVIIISLIAGSEELVPEEILRRTTNVRTVDWRMLRWEVAIEEGTANPILGVGLNNLRDALANAGIGYGTAHSSFLSLFAEVGILGLLTYLAIVISIIQLGWKLYRRGAHPRDQWRGIAVLAVFIGYQVPGLFSNTLYTTHLGQIYVYTFVGAIAGLYSRFPLASKLPKSSRSAHRRFGAYPPIREPDILGTAYSLRRENQAE